MDREERIAQRGLDEGAVSCDRSPLAASVQMEEVPGRNQDPEVHSSRVRAAEDMTDEQQADVVEKVLGGSKQCGKCRRWYGRLVNELEHLCFWCDNGVDPYKSGRI